MDEVKLKYETPKIVEEFDLKASCWTGGGGGINGGPGYLLDELLSDPFSGENPFDLR